MGRAVALLALGIAFGVMLTASPAGGHVSGWVHNWKKHIKPRTDARYYTRAKADARFLPGGNLPGGTTIRGAYRVTGNDQGAGLDLNGSGISFGQTLASAPAAHFVALGSAPPAECPGSPASPEAAPGHLCVHESYAGNTTGQVLGDPTTNKPGSSRVGAFIIAQSAGDGSWATAGTWAVTAP